MAKKRKAGRPKMADKERVKLVPGYFKDHEKMLINKAYGNLSNAVRQRVLPELLAS